MSTFSGLNTALSGLNAARTGLNVVGQNLTNVNTAGYTRQRAELSAVGMPANGSLFDVGVKPGQGVNVTGISRLGDTFLDARVRTAFSSAGYTSARADALTQIQDRMKEPGTEAISGQLHSFWAAWGDISNHAGETASTAKLLGSANSLAQNISEGYRALDNQWSQTRGRADMLVQEVNTTAGQIASLNDQIRSAAATGHPSNELIDQRNTLTAKISQLTGGTVRDLPNGDNEILVGGNVLVSGKQVNTLKVAGPNTMSEGKPVQLEWERRPGVAVDLDGGQLAGTLSVLGPANAGKTGGVIAETAAEYDRLAEKLAKQVNDIHTTAFKADGTLGDPFFGFKPGSGPGAAMRLEVKAQGPADIATSGSASNALNGSKADEIFKLGSAKDSPDAKWTETVLTTGAAVRVGLQQDVAAGTSLTNAMAAQQSNASVDIDEENVNLLSYTHAYQAASRVMTAIDEALDVLINQTGRVGR
ncbi:flagellar hook-associated protein FlgK [Arthrobacter sp. GMC3]|uniref:flagellar hook-associated protein FlgK n=1 Tax=Arthrobacter sp. GMC3 TaxID=2058894 RepID=UPI0015E3ADE3|nr:flagellar hook-associated protein FlgK [Arthrobacter sp. GMC3]